MLGLPGRDRETTAGSAARVDERREGRGALWLVPSTRPSSRRLAGGCAANLRVCLEFVRNLCRGIVV